MDGLGAALNVLNVERGENVHPGVQQLDYILATDPGHPGTVVTRAYMFSQEKKTSEAIPVGVQALARLRRFVKRPDFKKI